MKMDEIKGFSEWKSVKQIEKGWSSDQKYLVVTNQGEKLQLRIADISQYSAKEKEYAMIHKFAACGFTMSQPIDFGICNGGRNVYMILSWVEGQDLSECLSGLSAEEQYQLGREAGRILGMIHDIPVEEKDRPSKTHKEKKLIQLSRYEETPSLRQESDPPVIEFVRKNIDQIWTVPAVYQHGDFHPGNLILCPDHTIGVIDFNRWDVGDPYEEFYKLESFGVELSIPYCIGQIQSYFDDQVPEAFWKALAVYVAHASLFSIKWAEKFGQEDVDGMVQRYHQAFENYEGFTKIVPSWYEYR